MAAATVAQLAGVSHDAVVRAVESFTGLEHALEPVAVVDGVRFVNDSKATNVEAAQRAIESFERGLVVIMGGPLQERGFFAAARTASSAWRNRGDDRRSRSADSAGVRRHGAGRSGRDAGGGGAPVIRVGESGRSRRGAGPWAAASRTGRSSCAGVRQLRHVPRLRGAWSGVQEGSVEAGGGREAARGNGVPAPRRGFGAFRARDASGAIRAGRGAPRVNEDTRAVNSRQSA